MTWYDVHCSGVTLVARIESWLWGQGLWPGTSVGGSFSNEGDSTEQVRSGQILSSFRGEPPQWSCVFNKKSSRFPKGLGVSWEKQRSQGFGLEHREERAVTEWWGSWGWSRSMAWVAGNEEISLVTGSPCSSAHPVPPQALARGKRPLCWLNPTLFLLFPPTSLIFFFVTGKKNLSFLWASYLSANHSTPWSWC